MARYSDDVRDQYGAPVSGVSVYVYTHAGTLADLEEDGGGDLDNPLTSDEYGGFYFNADAGLYNLEFHYGGKEMQRDNGVMVGAGPVLPDEILAALINPGMAALIGTEDGDTVQEALDDLTESTPVALPTYRLPGATNDNAALAAAFAVGRSVYLPAGQGLGDDGEYLISTPNGTSNVPSGAHIFGDGMGKTVIKWTGTAGTFPFFIDAGSASLASNLANITFRDLTIEGAGGSFSQFQHNMWLGGVTNFLAERVEFKAFQGDGLYIGSGNNDPSTTERHNRNVTVRGCIFDGVNNANRNGISVIDCDGWVIEHCRFVNCTKLDGSMPGPIDAEPDANAFHVVRNGRIVFNEFVDCGGSAFALYLRPNTFPAVPYEGFEFAHNLIDGCFGAFAMVGFATAGAVAGVNPYNVSVHDNLISGCTEHVARFDGALGVKFEDNHAMDSPAIEFGNDTGATSRLVSITGNSFIRCGLEGHVFLLVEDTIDLSIANNFLSDCGKADGSLGRIVYLVGMNADLTRFRLDHNEVANPSSKTTAFAIQVGGYAGTIDSASTKIGNVLPTLGTADNLILSGIGPDFLQFSATFNPANLALGASGTIQTLAATGVALGDYVDAVSFSLDAAGVIFPAYVSATDVISYFAHNLGGADPTDLASGTITFRVRRKVL